MLAEIWRMSMLIPRPNNYKQRKIHRREKQILRKQRTKQLRLLFNSNNKRLREQEKKRKPPIKQNLKLKEH